MYTPSSKLVVWQKSHQLVLRVYEVTKDFPKEELFGLTSQLRRAAVSVPSNIIEGKARGSNNEYKRFLLIARASLEEAKYQMLLARDLHYINETNFNCINALANEVGKMLNGLINKL